jgi:IclR family transcriptional regulator, acetate operon repressor
VSAGGLYRVGSSILHLASGATPLAGLVDVARPHVRELAANTGEAAGLAVLEGRTVRYLDSAESVHAVQVRDWTGELVPLHVVPSGLVLLAHAGEPAIEAYLAAPLERFTEHTVTDADELRARLAEIRGRHHEWVIEEFAEGISSVAAAVRNRAGVVVAAVHAHGPAYRFPPDDVTRVEELVVRCAARVSARLAEPDRRTPGDR